jgi:hypothetical protein
MKVGHRDRYENRSDRDGRARRAVSYCRAKPTAEKVLGSFGLGRGSGVVGDFVHLLFLEVL